MKPGYWQEREKSILKPVQEIRWNGKAACIAYYRDNLDDYQKLYDRTFNSPDIIPIDTADVDDATEV